MSKLAAWIAHWLWWGSLWLMRRPWMKEFQRRAVGLLPSSRQEKAWRDIRNQNRFARRYGEAILQGVVTAFLVSVLLTGAFYFALYLEESGNLTLSDELRTRIEEGRASGR